MMTRVFAISAAGAVLALALAGCEDTSSVGVRGAPPAIVLSDVRLESYGPEGSTSVTTAREVTYRRDTGELAGEILRLDLPDGERVGRGGVVIVADRGQGDVKKRLARAEGNVVATTGDGDRTTTSEANYDGAAGTVQGDVPVRVEGPAYVLDAQGYVFHLEQDRLELRGGVVARARPDETVEAPAPEPGGVR